MTEQEHKLILIDNYVNLLKIKASEKAVNEELDIQLSIARLKLDIWGVDAKVFDDVLVSA